MPLLPLVPPNPVTRWGLPPVRKAFAMSDVFLFDHPLIQHKMSLMRDVRTTTKDFRELVEEVAMLMAYEVTRDSPLEPVDVTTPLGVCHCQHVAGKMLAIVPILRAGMGMAEGMVRLLPTAKVGHVGLYRDPQTLKPVEYYCKLPDDIEQRDVIVLDPMLATGGSAVAAVDALKKRGAKSLKFVCLLAVNEGITALAKAHPDVPVFCAAKDPYLNDHGYIVPGLGDAGDRIFGTK